MNSRMMNLDTTFAEVRKASRTLLRLPRKATDNMLRMLADATLRQADSILEANRKDLARMNPEDPKYDRLKLTEARLQDIAEGLCQVAGLPSPLGRTLKRRTLPNGLRIRRVSVPFGVIGIIYEARPNVSFDVFALCIKAGSACVLKGGSDAEYSNLAIVGLIRQVLEQCGMDRHLVELLPVGHEAADCLLHARGLVDLIIPRGGRGLIDFVRQNATVPVIETGAGVCHAYFDCYADLEKGKAIVLNAKTRRVSVCNALDCLIVDAARLADLPALCAPLQDKHVMIYADAASYNALKGAYPGALLQEAGADVYGKEFLDYKMAVKTTGSLADAIDHVSRYGSGHSECIITENKQRAGRFCREIDAACVYVNAPTSFTDGAQFGLGAEIGISTQKLHARGPMGLEEITTYKWLIEGEGQVRE